jgi:hypothetical protein
MSLDHLSLLASSTVLLLLLLLPALNHGRTLLLLDTQQQAVEAAPTAAALAGRASVHNKLKNYMEAAADASHAIELDDKLVPAHKEKG